MNKEKLNNVVFLNNVPSNLIDEVILILKPTDIQSKKKVEEYAKLEGSEFIRSYLLNEVNRKKNWKKKNILLAISFILIILFLSIVAYT